MALDKGDIMYKLIMLEDIVRVPPERFGDPLEEVVLDLLKEKYEGMLDKDLGVVIAVTDVKDITQGRLVPGDGASYHEVGFEALAFKPELQEVLEGEVVEIVEFGTFVRLGPLDGLIHVSQITDDYIVYDPGSNALVGKESKRMLKEGDKVRARVVAVSLDARRSRESKIGLTMRQPGLGKLEWLEEDRKEKEKETGKEKQEREGK